MNRKKRCINCGCKFYPQKHIVAQKYCSKERCQSARKEKWARNMTRYDRGYKARRKEAQNKWRDKNQEYWRLRKKGNTRKKATNKIREKPELKIVFKKSILSNLPKTGTIDCGCRLTLVP